MRLQWRDGLAIFGVVLAMAGLLIDNTAYVVGCLLLAVIVGCWSVATHKEAPVYVRLAIGGLIVLVAIATGAAILHANREKRLAALEGTLYPDTLPDSTIFVPECTIPKDALRIVIGGNLVAATQFPITVLNLRGRNTFTIDRERDNAIVIAHLEIFDDRHDTIVSIENNKIWVNPFARKTRPDESTLVVYDHNNNTVLSVRFINRTLLSVVGIFQDYGFAPIIATDKAISFGGTTLHQSCVVGGGLLRVQ
jgi:hypothetical protein